MIKAVSVAPSRVTIILTVTLDPVTCLFDSKPNMDSSHTLSAAISILFPLSTCLETLELSVSLDVKSTQMGEFTSMLSSCSNGSLAQEMSVYSMWMDSTQMSALVGVHQRRVGIMRRSMAMLSRVDSRDPEVGFLRLALYGLQSSFQKTERAFLKLARDWLREHFCVTSLPSDVMPIGGIDLNPNPTFTLQSYRSTQQAFQNSISGYNKIWWDLELKVSVSCPSSPHRARPIPAGCGPKGPCGGWLDSRAPRNRKISRGFLGAC